MQLPVKMQWIILAVAVSVVAGCPKDIMREVGQCMSPLEGYSGNGGGLFMVMSGLDKTSQMCKDKAIQNAFSCLSKIYNNCAKTREGARHFDLLVDVHKWRQAMENICDNIFYLQDHAACEAQASEEYQPCAEKETIIFTEQIASVRSQMNAPQYVTENQKFEAFIDIGCAFTVKILDCLRNPFEKYCPKAMTNLVVDTVQNMMPPACARRALSRSYDMIPKYNYDDGLKAYDKSNDNSNNNEGDNDDDNYIRKEIIIGNPKTSDDRNQRGGDDDNDGINSPRSKEGVGAARSSKREGENGGHRCGASLIILMVASILAFLPWSHVGI